MALMVVSACESDNNSKTADLIFSGTIDPDLSLYSEIVYDLTRDKRKCKSWTFDLFSVDKWRLINKTKKIESFPKPFSNFYELVVPLSEIDNYTSCHPKIESARLCIYKTLPNVERCSSGLYYGDKLLFCVTKSNSPLKDPSCSSYVDISSYILNGFDYNYAEISCVFDHKSSFVRDYVCELLNKKIIDMNKNSFKIDIQLDSIETNNINE